MCLTKDKSGVQREFLISSQVYAANDFGNDEEIVFAGLNGEHRYICPRPVRLQIEALLSFVSRLFFRTFIGGDFK